MAFILVVVGGAVRSRRHWGNAAVLAELFRPAGSRKAWIGLGGGCCCFSPSKIGARTQGRPGSAGHTARGTAGLAKEQRPLPSPPSSASSSDALAKLPQRLRSEKTAMPSVSGRHMGPRRCAQAVPTGSLPDLPRRHGQGLAGNGGMNRCKPGEIWCMPAFCRQSFHAGRTGGAASPLVSTIALGILASQHLGVCCFVLVSFFPSVGKSWKEGLLGGAAQTAQEPARCPPAGGGRPQSPSLLPRAELPGWPPLSKVLNAKILRRAKGRVCCPRTLTFLREGKHMKFLKGGSME